jgi:hypothetical protein
MINVNNTHKTSVRGSHAQAEMGNHPNNLHNSRPHHPPVAPLVNVLTATERPPRSTLFLR